MDGAAVIVHCATSSRGDTEATQNLIEAARRGGAPHLVFPSIVGLERMSSWSYPKAKLQAERAVIGSRLPWTILRLTQFYDYILSGARQLARLPVVPVPAGFRCQPIDSEETAARLVELALGEPGGRVADMAGPKATTWADMQREYLRVRHMRRWMMPVRIPGTRAVRAGALLPGPRAAMGHQTWEQFLTTNLHPQAAGAAETG